MPISRMVQKHPAPVEPVLPLPLQRGHFLRLGGFPLPVRCFHTESLIVTVPLPLHCLQVAMVILPLPSV